MINYSEFPTKQLMGSDHQSKITMMASIVGKSMISPKIKETDKDLIDWMKSGSIPNQRSRAIEMVETSRVGT